MAYRHTAPAGLRTSRGGIRLEKHRHIFEQFATFDNMYDGYLLARKHKRYQDCVLEYTNLLEDNLIDAVNRLQWHEYQTGPLHQFYEYYPKKRIISSLPFYDRVVNCAAYNVTWPIYSKSFYEHSYGSVPGKGPVRCANTIQGWMREAAAKPGDWYFVKMDITKFFFRIPTEVQLRELGRPLDDADMMWFFERAIRCDGRPLGLPLHCTDVTTAERIAGRGMQVGSLVSQMTANVVMTPADHYIKRELCAPYYARYMDDMGAIIEGNLTKHSYFTSTACPGPYLGGKFSWLAEEVNKRLAGGVTVAGDALRAGMALHLERTNLYIASASLAIAGVRTGTYYLWGAEVINGRVRITNSTSNVGKYGKVTGWISVDDAKAGAGLRDQTTDSRGLTKIVIDYASNVQAMAVYNLAQQLDLVAPGYYRSRYIDAAKTAQYIEIGQISAGDAEHVTTLCKKAAIEYKTAA